MIAKSDPQRTIDFLDDQLGRDQARWTALMRDLAALVADMRVSKQYTLPRMRPEIVENYWAGRLARVLDQYDEEHTDGTGERRT